MQATETGTNKPQKRVKDDNSINFRPSPNFKHMKKYLKFKFEEDMSSSSSLDSKESEGQMKEQDVKPPLPPNSPPPDSPLSFTLKKEIEDDDYEQFTRSEETSLEQTVAPARNGVNWGAGGDKKKAVMCKDFVRKTCTRGAACIYAHELDVSQLKGVYRFCRDFGNSRCDRRVCHFVHATTFEKEHFFRTGELPAHALAHLSAAAPQPPPFAAPPPEPQPELPAIFHPLHPPPQTLPSVGAAAPVPLPGPGSAALGPAGLGSAGLVSADLGSAGLGSAGLGPAVLGTAAMGPVGLEPAGLGPAGAALERRLQVPASVFPALPAAAADSPAISIAAAAVATAVATATATANSLTTHALKREWRDIKDFCSSPCDLDSNEPLAKTCKLTQLRVQRARAQLEDEVLALRELDERLQLQLKKNNSLFHIQQSLLKPRRAYEFMEQASLAGRGAGAFNKDMVSRHLYRNLRLVT